ncbi:PrpF domain-containing protein [Pseudonocardia sp. HH130629-09]|uniref:PrpF domain-containing protein n=1 Tax=Pseudonocardia sp. HH130629-09 TaxID=1641402 RepID=UPI0006CB6B1A|nr:PrpF domain-containing protein [Pseudonocardia sp. HH130629-09]ALE84066.1 hypothetical protein XF36_13720 [Pseudonocardia sp. HH130629-09]
MLGAVSVVTAGLIEGSVAHDVLVRGAGGPLAVEHPTGTFEVQVDLDASSPPRVERSTVVRTARTLFDGIAVPRA